MATTFAADKKIENDLSDYDYIISTGLSIESQLIAWNGKFETLRGTVPAEKQAELDNIKSIAVAKYITALGL